MDKAIADKNFKDAVKFMDAHTRIAVGEANTVQRLLFKLTDLNMTDLIEEIFSILIPTNFIFDSIEYCHALRPLVSTGRVTVAVTVIKKLL